MRDERGFALVETMVAVLILAFMVLAVSGLWRAAQTADAGSEWMFHLSREAVNQMEAWRLETELTSGTTTREWRLQQILVAERKAVQWEDGLWKLTLTYQWQEGGRTREQTWATLRLP
jgi:Tfp pilus assembly protein PilV